MLVRPRRSAPAALATAAALVAGGLGAGTLTASPASAHDGQQARAVSLFPSDDLTVRDDRQTTGRRVALPTDGCTAPVECGLIARVNQLDGFDLDPRLALRFSGPVDPVAVAAATTLTAQGDRGRDDDWGSWAEDEGRGRGGHGHDRGIGVDRVVYDAATFTVYAHPARQLAPSTRYALRVERTGRGTHQAQTHFTTLSATDGLLDLRRQLDRGALDAAGIPERARGLQVDGRFPLAGTTITQLQDRGPAGAAAARTAALAAGLPDPVEDGLVKVPVANASTGTVVFGSYLAPSWLNADRTITQTPTRDAGPRPVGQARLPFVLVLPASPEPAGGYPTAVFGHGFTGQAANVLLAAAAGSAAGTATIATTVVGHGYGPRTVYRVSSGGATTEVPAYGRGIDLDGNGAIDSTEGSSTRVGSEAAAVSSRDGLRQTALDVMALVREVQRGADVDGTPGDDLSRSGTGYYGQSFGGIYGTMVAGADPRVARAALNVPGGPISEIARLSPAFRLLTTQALQSVGLLNSTDATRAFFIESLPLRGQAPVLDPAPGALAIQDYLATSTWLTRPGSPETFAPLVRDEDALFQSAFGDQTVPNPTAYTLYAAGDLFDRVSLFRNDKSPEGVTPTGAVRNPHGFLLDLANYRVAGLQAQSQINTFLRTGAVVDPDGAGAVWEVPIADPSVLLRLNYTSPAFPQG